MSQAIIKTLTNAEGSETIYPRTTKEAVYGLGNIIYAHGDEVETEVSSEYLKSTPQELSDAQKAQVRSNIGAADVSEVAHKNKVVNPNLLDNWYFGNPVNQRGQTEYSNSEWSATYGIDRWYLSVASFDVQAKRLTAIANYSRMVQCIQDKSLIGKTVTFSALISSCVSTAVGLLVSDDVNGDYVISMGKSGEAGVLSTTFTVKDYGEYSKIILSVLVETAGGHAVVEAAKLELGDTQTLAHQENGVWVLNEIPNYADEMAKCAQYNPTTGIHNGPFTMTKLWENASLTSTFGAQTISVSLDGYDMIFCTGKSDYAANTGLYLTSSFVPNIVGNTGVIFEMYTDGWEQTRSFTIASNGITFSNGYMANHSGHAYHTDRNDRAIPTAIYGIKGVL